MEADGITSGIRNKRENHSLPFTILIINMAIPSERARFKGVDIPINRIVFNNPLIYALLENKFIKLEKPTNEPFTGLSKKAYTRERQKGNIKNITKPRRPGSTNKNSWLKIPDFFTIPLSFIFLFIEVTR